MPTERAMIRNAVYEVIDGEREYQDRKWGDRGVGHEPSAYLTFMRPYLQAADAAAATGDIDEQLHNIRKVAALCVACMEENGAPSR